MTFFSKSCHDSDSMKLGLRIDIEVTWNSPSLGQDDFWKFSQMFLDINLNSSVMLRWMLVLENYQKASHKLLLWCEILICGNCRFIKHLTIKMSRFYIWPSHYVLCLQRFLGIENVHYRVSHKKVTFRNSAFFMVNSRLSVIIILLKIILPYTPPHQPHILKFPRLALCVYI